jgi:cytochrome c
MTLRLAMLPFRLPPCWRALALALGLLAVATPALASPELARSRNCIACHLAERRLVGPAYSAIAARYANQPEAVRILSERVIAGAEGVWGPLPMPPQPDVTPAEAEALVRWILSHR